ncbi:uncharacterized protein A1O5_01638 [Cladophialophora psammophila CBS 110553]|uniref:Uncharacterized protein n=1 Tax=Cladophialophora psammophila CBS 110553 TaxID=1182543 RepID=W9X399_9EURO|nr:uncharacterized protein A1O5_01638 [Cladophialophora psammophila CBS 110553]EXJ74942.1 hypothetical protein A1O5_01638 [Cladophialophora psammophila CBS 110553]
MTLELAINPCTGFFALILTLQVLHAMAMPFNLANVSGVRSNSCVWEFSPTICGEDVGYQELAYPENTVCMPLTVGMKNVWTNECSSWFGES